MTARDINGRDLKVGQRVYEYCRWRTRRGFVVRVEPGAWVIVRDIYGVERGFAASALAVVRNQRRAHRGR